MSSSGLTSTGWSSMGDQALHPASGRGERRQDAGRVVRAGQGSERRGRGHRHGPVAVRRGLAADLALPIEELDLTVAPQLPQARGHPHRKWAGGTQRGRPVDIRNFGAKSIDEVKAKLAGMGLTLRTAPGFDPRSSSTASVPTTTCPRRRRQLLAARDGQQAPKTSSPAARDDSWTGSAAPAARDGSWATEVQRLQPPD